MEAVGEHGNGNGNGNGNAKGRGKEPMEPPKQCPRCFSTTTKFCYYNNRSVAQPRHFCKSCRRFWTHGGALRNVPIGGGSRKGTKKMGKGDLSSGSLSSCSSFHVGESSRVGELISPVQQPQPPQSTTPPPLLAHMRAFSNNGMSLSDSSTLQGGIFPSFAGMQNFNLLQGFNQVPMNGGAGGIQGTTSANFSLLQGSSGSPNLTRPPQIQQPVYPSDNGQQAMAQPSRPIGSLMQAFVNHPSGSSINASLGGSNDVAGSGYALNYSFLWSDEFDADDVDDLFSGSSPPHPFS